MDDNGGLIGKILAQSASKKEVDIFNKWLNESAANRDEYELFKKVWDSKRILHQYDLELARSKIALRIDRPGITMGTIINYWQRVAAVLLIPLIAISVFMLLQLNDQALKEYHSAIQTVECPRGIRSKMNLPDGTMVYLNSGSSLTFPVSFSGEKTRNVSLTGEAYFDVSKDAKHPFLLNMEDVCLKVIGTSFNVSNYKEDKQVEIMLESGKVDLYTGSNRKSDDCTRLVPGQLATIEKGTDVLSVNQAKAEHLISWTKGYLIFDDDKMSDVIRKLERWYNVEIIVSDQEINQYLFTATIKDLSIEQVLNLLQFTSPIEYHIVNTDETGKILDRKEIIITKRD